MPVRLEGGRMRTLPSDHVDSGSYSPVTLQSVLDRLEVPRHPEAEP